MIDHTLEETAVELKHAEYLPLAALISETDTPTLRAEIELHDELRVKLLKIISALLSEAKAVEPSVAGASSEAASAHLKSRRSSPKTEFPNKP